MPRGSSPKRERQYEHIESSARKRGASAGRAKEIAARTVNKQRAQSGEVGNSSSSGGSSRSSSRSRSGGSSSSRGGGSSSSRSSGRQSSSSGSGGQTYRELYAEARRRDIKGRSSMDKSQLERALASAGGKRGK